MPVDIVNAFPVTDTLASAETTAVPVAKVNGLPVGLKLASPVIDNVPKPSVNGFAVASSTIESAVIPMLPIVIVNDVLVAVIVTFLSSAAVANGNSENALNPNLIYP